MTMVIEYSPYVALTLVTEIILCLIIYCSLKGNGARVKGHGVIKNLMDTINWVYSIQTIKEK